MKKSIIAVAVLVILLGGFFAFNSYIYNKKQGDGPALSARDATYVVGGEVVTLKDGYAETKVALDSAGSPQADSDDSPQADSASKTITRYFGNEVKADIDADGREDVAFILTQEGGGSGTFYYVVAALNKPEGYEGTQALYLGDRIAPQTTEFRDGLIIVNYADRLPGEPMATQPSMGKSLYLKYDVDSNYFGEVVQDFEGEANPATMNLTMKTWTWQHTENKDETVVKPKQTRAFTLEFLPDEGLPAMPAHAGQAGRFSATTDCNRVAGNYKSQSENGEGAMSFSDMISTKMYCEGSQESAFTIMLEEAESFHFTSKGELIITLSTDSEMYFR